MNDEADTYENRALFMVMLHGAPHEELKARFPEWRAEWLKQRTETDRTLWYLAFCRGALARKTTPSQS